METNSEMNTNCWVDHHLAKLSPGADWQPNSVRAFARFEELRRPVSRKLTWAVAAIIAACICVIAFLAINAKRPEKVSAAAVTLKEGQTPPDFKLPDSTGASIRLSDYKGKVVLLNFWATWCHGCKTEIPWFMEFAATYKDRGLVVLGVALDDDGWKPVRPYIAEKKINYAVVVGSPALAAQYGVEPMPMTYLIDRRGKVAATHIGMVDKDTTEKEIVQMLR
jgi:peroxiredoxin